MKKTWTLCKAIIISTALSFLGFFLLNTIVRALFEGSDNISIILYCFNIIIYCFCFYLIKTNKRDKLYQPSGEFGITSEVKHYYVFEGKNLLCIYTVLAILCELNDVIVQESGGKFFIFICSMFFPFFSSIKVPILRSIVSLMLITTISLILEVYKSYKIKK